MRAKQRTTTCKAAPLNISPFLLNGTISERKDRELGRTGVAVVGSWKSMPRFWQRFSRVWSRISSHHRALIATLGRVIATLHTSDSETASGFAICAYSSSRLRWRRTRIKTDWLSPNTSLSDGQQNGPREEDSYHRRWSRWGDCC